MSLDWTWEMGGTGPHFFLSLQFGPDADVASVLPANLVRLGDGSWGHPDDGEFAFLRVGLRDGVVVVTRGCLAENPGDDQDLAERLLMTGPLGDWEVSSGGDGYPMTYIRAGTGEESFRAYCRRQARPAAPEATRVLPAVAEELAAQGLDGTYRLGGAEEAERFEGRRLRVPLHHRATSSNVPVFGMDLDPVARALARRSGVAVSAVAGDPHLPFPRPAGNLEFGL